MFVVQAKDGEDWKSYYKPVFEITEAHNLMKGLMAADPAQPFKVVG